MGNWKAIQDLEVILHKIGILNSWMTVIRKPTDCWTWWTCHIMIFYKVAGSQCRGLVRTCLQFVSNTSLVVCINIIWFFHSHFKRPATTASWLCDQWCIRVPIHKIISFSTNLPAVLAGFTQIRKVCFCWCATFKGRTFRFNILRDRAAFRGKEGWQPWLIICKLVKLVRNPWREQNKLIVNEIK